MKKSFGLFLVLFFITSGISAYAQKTYNPEITSKEIQENINYLASEKLEGRFTGSEGANLAASFIEKDFKELNLKPLFNGSYFQEFPFIASLKLTKNNSLEFDLNNIEIKPKIESEFITAPFSGKSEVSGDLIFAGYGISAPELKYDDYAGIDVTGK